MQEEVEFNCPHCWQPNSVLLDCSAGSQRLIQDCEVCCNPYELEYQCSGGEIVSFDVRSIEQ